MKQQHIGVTMIDYTHLALNDEVECIGGFYCPEKEVKLECDGREVLYVIGQAVIESSCCGGGSWRYAIVPGFILEWQDRVNEAGLPVSELESISDEAVRKDIRKTIQESENIYAVEFW